MANNGMTVVQHSRSPDLAHCKLFSFSKSQAGTEGRIFHDVSRIQEQQQGTLANFQIKKVTKCFQQSCNHWDHCVKSQGDQFERGSMEQHFIDVIIDRNTIQKLSGHTFYYTHSPECRRTTMMHVVASSDPRIFTFSAKNAQVVSVLAVVL
jgi:hypothetical protein